MSLILIRALLWLVGLIVLAASVGSDLRDRTIPNESVILVAVSGLALRFVSKPGTAWVSLLAAAILLSGLWVLVRYDFLGGGDAKLIAAASLLVPPEHIALLLMEIALAGGLLSLTYLAAAYFLRRPAVPRGGPAQFGAAGATHGVHRFLRNEHARITSGNSVPYAMAVLGGVSVYVVSELHQCLFAISCSL